MAKRRGVRGWSAALLSLSAAVACVDADATYLGLEAGVGGSAGTDPGPECRTNADCDVSEACVGGTCGACAATAQCDSGEVCNPGAHSCVAGDCLSNADCLGTEACIGFSCSPCLQSSECDSGEVCRQDVHQCVTGDCASNAECTGTNVCNAFTCAPCTASSQCNAGTVCLPDRHVCAPGNCLTNADCAQTQSCVTRTCGPCASSSQCDVGEVCDPGSQSCVVGTCLGNADCSAEQACRNNTCGSCILSSQCDVGEVCDPGSQTCVLGNCLGNLDCSGGQVCLDHSCAACATSSECDTNQICRTDTHVCVIGECASNADCGAELCDTTSFSCVQCLADSQCATNEGCQLGTGNCVPANFSTAVATPIGDGLPSVVTSTLVVSGAGLFIWDVNVTTGLVHTFGADIDMTLTSPAGTIVTLTTDNGDGGSNVFAGTLWDDSADQGGALPYESNAGLASDRIFVSELTATPIAPEEPLGAFFGEDPNGTWTITISDDAAEDGGSLGSWSLAIATLSQAPTLTALTESTLETSTLTDVDVTTSTLAVPAQTAGTIVCGVTVQTNILHPTAQDIDMTLTSPSGRVVTLTTDNGVNSANVFNGTLWSDSAAPGGLLPYASAAGQVTDALYASNVPQLSLTPEEGLSSFRGEAPGGNWVLTISDDALEDGGTLNGWTLNLQTCAF